MKKLFLFLVGGLFSMLGGMPQINIKLVATDDQTVECDAEVLRRESLTIKGILENLGDQATNGSIPLPYTYKELNKIFHYLAVAHSIRMRCGSAQEEEKQNLIQELNNEKSEEFKGLLKAFNYLDSPLLLNVGINIFASKLCQPDQLELFKQNQEYVSQLDIDDHLKNIMVAKIKEVELIPFTNSMLSKYVDSMKPSYKGFLNFPTILSLDVSPDGRWLASAVSGEDWSDGPDVRNSTLRIHEMRDGKFTGRSKQYGYSKTRGKSVAFSPDGKWLAFAFKARRYRVAPQYLEETLRIYKLLDGECTETYLSFTDHMGWIKAVAFSSDGRWFATGSADHSVRLYNIIDGNFHLVARLVAHDAHAGWEPRTTNEVTALAFSPDGEWLATGSQDLTVRIYHLSDLSASWQFADHGQSPSYVGRFLQSRNHISSLAFSPDSNLLITSSLSNTICLYRISEGEPSLFRQITDHTFKHRSEYVTYNEGQEDQHTERIEYDQPEEIASITFSPDGKWFVSGGYENSEICFYRYSNNDIQLIKKFKICNSLLPACLNSIAFTPDSKCVAFGVHQTCYLYHLDLLGEGTLSLEGALFLAVCYKLAAHNERITLGDGNALIKYFDQLPKRLQNILLEQGHVKLDLPLKFSRFAATFAHWLFS